MNQTLFLRIGLGIFSALLCYVIWRIVKLLWDVIQRGYQLRHIPGPPPTSFLLGNPIGANDFIHRNFPEYVKKYGKVSSNRILISPLKQEDLAFLRHIDLQDENRAQMDSRSRRTRSD